MNQPEIPTIKELEELEKQTKEANNYSKKMMIKNMNKLLSWKEKKEPGATQMLQILWTNYEGQVLLGENNIKL